MTTTMSEHIPNPDQARLEIDSAIIDYFNGPISDYIVPRLNKIRDRLGRRVKAWFGIEFGIWVDGDYFELTGYLDGCKEVKWITSMPEELRLTSSVQEIFVLLGNLAQAFNGIEMPYEIEICSDTPETME